MRRKQPEPFVLEQVAKDIVVVQAAEQMAEDYTLYASYVNLGRALPNVLDGLKPVQRRVLYAMAELGLKHDVKFVKCAKIDGLVTGNYSPHGCLAYDTRVCLADGTTEAIGDLVKLDATITVKSFDKSAGFIDAEAKYFRVGQRTNAQYTISLSDTDGKIECTGNHKFLTLDRDWVAAEDLRMSDCLFTEQGYRKIYSLWVDGLAEDLDFYDCTVVETECFFIEVGGVQVLTHNSAYGVLVNVANDWANRYQFVDGQGNFGTTEDGPAAARYTEARMHKFAELVLTEHLDDNWIDFKPNYDASTTEPTVLPARLPVLLLRDTAGIGVATACRHVSYLLSEVAELAKAALKKRLVPDEGPLYVTAPDFAMGGDLLYDEAVSSVIRDGVGTLRLYAKFRIEDNLLVCYELPQDVSGEAVLNQTFNLIKSEHIGRKTLLDARNETDRSGTRVVWELRSASDIPMLQKLLFDKTDCRVTVSVNAVSVNSDGKSYSLKGVAEVANEWAAFRKSYEIKRLSFESAKLLSRGSILSGMLIALDNIVLVAQSLIDGVSLDTLGLNLNEDQIEAIEAMPLRTLKAKSRLKLKAEIAEVAKQAAWRNKVLESDANMVRHLCKDVESMAAEFSDERRTSRLDTAVLETVAKAAAELQVKALAEKHNGYLVDLVQEDKAHEFYLRSSRSKKLTYKDCGPGTDVGIACLLSNGSLYFVPVSALQLDGSGTINTVLAVQKYTGKSMTGVKCCWSKAVDRNNSTDLSLVLVAAGSHYGGRKSVARTVPLVMLSGLQGRIKSAWIDVCSAHVLEVQPKAKTVTVTMAPDAKTKYKLTDLGKVTQLGKAEVLEISP